MTELINIDDICAALDEAKLEAELEREELLRSAEERMLRFNMSRADMLDDLDCEERNLHALDKAMS